jgi:uncharacterized membrane protein
LNSKRSSQLKKIGLYLMSLFYVLAGFNHFHSPEVYLPMMPSFLPWPEQLILLSGLAEMGLGILLLVPKTRRIAAWGIIALLLAVFPANIQMLVLHDSTYQNIPLYILIGRLPGQLLFIWWAYIYTRRDSAENSETSRA